MKTALIFIHQKHEGPGQFGDILKARGFGTKIILTPQESVNDFDALAPDLVLVMGGPMGVYESDVYEFLNEEKEFLQKRIKADKPTLGVCLGAQLMAAALGEEVFKGKQGQEIGWAPLVDVAKNHPIRHLAGDKTSMFHWHGDTFELPKGADLLASSNLYKNQAFSYGKNILALQCHPEITPDVAEAWMDGSERQITKSKIAGSVQEFGTHTALYIDRMNVQSKLFFEEWLESVGL